MKEVMLKVNGKKIPCPSVFSWGLQDISAADAGRTDDTDMHKNRVGQVRAIDLQWNGLDWKTTAQILRAVNPEYFEVTYPDMMSGVYETRKFYVGDRKSNVKLWWDGKKLIETLSFTIIEKKGRKT